MYLLLLTAILAVTAAQQNLRDPIKDFCRRHQHQTCIIDSKLYIDGGKVYYGGSVENDSVAQQNTQLLWEDVRDTNNQYMFPTQYKNLSKDTDVPSVSGGALWPDTTNKLFYLFGGEYNEVTGVQTFTNLWLFDVVYNTWNKSSASDGSQAGVSWPALGAATVSDAGTAYYYGGYLNNKTVPKWSGEPIMLNSLTSYDMNTRSWSNHTYDKTPRAEGSLHFLPASAAGMLVYFGGVEMNSTGGVSFANMSQIQLFDINDNKWYTQSASGDVPDPRRGACAGVIWAEDRSSYNFYLWGGIAANGNAFDEAYILTLPSFQWTRIYPAPPASVPNYGGKGWSSCNVIRNSQMIIMGGEATNKSVVECDVPNMGGQHGLLLGQESVEVENWWHAVKSDVNRYRVPDKIVELVGGNADGRATKTAPVQGWAIPSLAGYWRGTMDIRSRTATRTLPATQTADQPTSQPTSAPSKTNMGAIAGGTIGGVVALAGIIALVFICLRRRRKQATHRGAEHDPSPGPNPHDPGMAQKHVAHASVSQSSTMFASMAQSPTYSPQASPPPPNTWHGDQSYYQTSPPQQYQNGEWAQPGSHPYPQTYYPPPPDPSQSPARESPYEISAELPNVRSPANAEMLDVRSPVGSQLPDLRSPVPVRGVL